jgi:hypothetical protein
LPTVVVPPDVEVDMLLVNDMYPSATEFTTFATEPPPIATA